MTHAAFHREQMLSSLIAPRIRQTELTFVQTPTFAATPAEEGHPTLFSADRVADAFMAVPLSLRLKGPFVIGEGLSVYGCLDSDCLLVRDRQGTDPCMSVHARLDFVRREPLFFQLLVEMCTTMGCQMRSDELGMTVAPQPDALHGLCDAIARRTPNLSSHVEVSDAR